MHCTLNLPSRGLLQLPSSSCHPLCATRSPKEAAEAGGAAVHSSTQLQHTASSGHHGNRGCWQRAEGDLCWQRSVMPRGHSDGQEGWWSVGSKLGHGNAAGRRDTSCWGVPHTLELFACREMLSSGFLPSVTVPWCQANPSRAAELLAQTWERKQTSWNSCCWVFGGGESCKSCSPSTATPLLAWPQHLETTRQCGTGARIWVKEDRDLLERV